MKDKGFTLVELLAVMVILGILILIGTMTVSNIFDNSARNFYKSMENTLGIAGNEFFNDNREDKPIDDYSFVDMDTLINHEYLEELKTYDGKNTCDPKTGVYIYNTDSGNQYEVCLICGDYQSSGPFCKGLKLGTITVSGNINSENGAYYNPLLSYSGTSWINASVVYIHFGLEGEDTNVTKYQVYDSNTSAPIDSCSASGNKCYVKISTSGSYYVEAYGTQGDDSTEKKIANRKYFNVKIDNTAPTYDLANTDPDLELEKDNIIYDYENEVIDIHDDNGYREVLYTLIRYNTEKPNNEEIIAKDVDIKSTDLKIRHKLESGKYDLYIKVTDFAGNVGTSTHSHITFYIKYNVDLEFFDNQDNKHEVGSIKVYTYGLYEGLEDSVKIKDNLQPVTWYRNANLVGDVVTSNSQVYKTGHHVLYGNEQKMRVSFKPECRNLVYNGEMQQLAKIPENEQGKYRLVVYYRNQLLGNQGMDARTYTIIGILNSEYTWTDGSRGARTIQCKIYPQPVTKPTCITRTYNGASQKLVDHVGNDGNQMGASGGRAFYLDKVPFGVNAGTYPFTATLDAEHNYSWDGTFNFPTVSLSCIINKKVIPSNFKCRTLTYNNDRQALIDGATGTEYQADDSHSGGERVSLFGDPDVSITPDGSTGWAEDGGWVVGAGSGDGGFNGNVNIPMNGGKISEPMYSVAPMYGVNAHNYDVVITIMSDNYTFAEGNRITRVCKINPKPITLKWSDTDTFEYDTKEHIRDGGADEVYIADIEDYDSEIDVDIQTPQTELGSYIATATCSSGICFASDNCCSNYTITNPKMPFKIRDTTAPSCSLSLTDEEYGEVTLKASDTHGITSVSGGINGLSGIKYASPERSIYEYGNVSSAGRHSVTVSDASGNSRSCSISVKIVHQKRTSSCKTHKSCVDDSCSCKTYNSCPASTCGCYLYNRCSACGCDTYNDDGTCKQYCRSSACTCNTYNSCENSSCTCKEHNSCVNDNCACDKWNSPSDWSDVSSCSEGETKDTKTECRDIFRKA